MIGLYREVRLSERDRIFAGIAVLSDQIAGVTSQREVIHFSLAA